MTRDMNQQCGLILPDSCEQPVGDPVSQVDSDGL